MTLLAYPGFTYPTDWRPSDETLIGANAADHVNDATLDHDAKHTHRTHPWCPRCEDTAALPDPYRLAQARTRLGQPDDFTKLLADIERLVNTTTPAPVDVEHLGDDHDLDTDSILAAIEYAYALDERDNAVRERATVDLSYLEHVYPLQHLCLSRATRYLRKHNQRPPVDNYDPARDDPDEAGRHSWSPVDLGPFLDGTHVLETPALLARTDGVCLLYPGLVHDFHGESESGKSLVAQAESAARIQAGDNVLYVDFESGPHQLVGRLLMLGCTREQITAHFTYVRPESSPHATTELVAWLELLTRPFVLAVLDGVTDALGLEGASTKDNDDIAAWHRNVARPLATRTGAAVVLIDHVAKATDTRGRFALGGQAKMAAIDGASYVVEIVEPIGKGMRGTVTLRIGKDRPGEVRARCGRYRATDRTQEAARIVVDSTGALTLVTVEPPSDNVSDAPDAIRPFKPTGVMEKVSRLLEVMREPVSQNKLLQAYKGDGGKARDNTVYEAINLLAATGHLTEDVGSRNARMFKSAAVYRQRSDPESDAYEVPFSDLIEPLPTSSATSSREVHTTSSHHLPPVGEVEEVKTTTTNSPLPTVWCTSCGAALSTFRAEHGYTTCASHDAHDPARDVA